jgi:tetratricopeptide (TPR) repeat protein
VNSRTCRPTLAAGLAWIPLGKPAETGLGVASRQTRDDEIRMSLVLTVVSPKVIYQSADYRLIDLRTNETRDFDTQKLFLANTHTWSAIVGFAGVGRTADVDVAFWLSEQIAGLDHEGPIEQLLERLMSANEWLRPLSKRREHSFSVGAFVGSRAAFYLVSNFERINGTRRPIAESQLQLSRFDPRGPRIFVSGQSVPRSGRRRLEALVKRDPDPERVYEALESLNKEVARANRTVSPDCLTAHVRLTGEGGSMPRGTGERSIRMPLLSEAQDIIDQVVAQHFPEGGRVSAMWTGRFDASEDYHQTQLQEKPTDPNAHSNYGAFLADNGDDAGAEREYRAALDLDDGHVNALGNLANLLWRTGRLDEARDKYERALAIGAGKTLPYANFARFVAVVDNDMERAEELISAGLRRDPSSEDLLRVGGDIALQRKDASLALARFRTLRASRGGEPDVERNYSIALHMSGASAEDCIAAYRVVLAVDHTSTAAELALYHLNLAQLLFVIGAHIEARRHLEEAESSGLREEDQLEALFYRLAHTEEPRMQSLGAIKRLIGRGVRTNWDFERNIDVVADERPNDAQMLRVVAGVIRGRGPVTALDGLGEA